MGIWGIHERNELRNTVVVVHVKFVRFPFNIVCVLYLLSGRQVFHTVWLEECEVQQGLEETHSFLGVTGLPQKMALLEEDPCRMKELPVSGSLEFW